MTDQTGVRGFDVGKVQTWLPTVAEVAAPFQWQRLEGGHSNLTYLLTDANGREMVIRRPPEGDLLPKAHDMQREYTVIDGLWGTGVPVAEPIAYCDDPTVNETHFYVMGKADGQALYEGEVVRDYLDEAARRRAGEVFIDTLARLHSIDPADVGLERFGRPDAYVERQLKTWYGSWTASSPIANFDDPRIHELHEYLVANIPEQGPGRIVHGDFGPHNSLFAPDGTINAVLDWELSTLGDPYADFTYSINAWIEPGEPAAYGADPATALPGFPSRADLIDRYAAQTGIDLSLMPYYRTFNYFKYAGIMIGVYARYVAGQKSTEGVDLEMVFERLKVAVDKAAETAETIPR